MQLQNFSKSWVWDRVPEESTLILGDTWILFQHNVKQVEGSLCAINHLDSFSYFDTYRLVTDGRTNRRTHGDSKASRGWRPPWSSRLPETASARRVRHACSVDQRKEDSRETGSLDSRCWPWRRAEDTVAPPTWDTDGAPPNDARWTDSGWDETSGTNRF